MGFVIVVVMSNVVVQEPSAHILDNSKKRGILDTLATIIN